MKKYLILMASLVVSASVFADYSDDILKKYGKSTCRSGDKFTQIKSLEPFKYEAIVAPEDDDYKHKKMWFNEIKLFKNKVCELEYQSRTVGETSSSLIYEKKCNWSSSKKGQVDISEYPSGIPIMSFKVDSGDRLPTYVRKSLPDARLSKDIKTTLIFKSEACQIDF